MPTKVLQYFNERTGAIIGLLSLIVAIAIAVIQLRPKTREITCNVVSSTELTSVSQVPGLTSDFMYRQKKVVHLWKINLNLINSGNETLIGEGQHSTLIKDSVSLQFSDNTEILNIEPINSDLPIQFEQKLPNVFALKFPQWRTGEQANVSIYITSQEMQASPLLPQVPTRDIVDGYVRVTNALNPVSPPKNLIERLPVWTRILVKIGLTGVCLFATFIGIILIQGEVIIYFRVASWKRRHLTNFKKFIENREGIKQEDKERVIAEPTILHEDVWKEFNGKRLTIKDTSGFGSAWSAFGISMLGLFVGVVCLVYVLSNLYELYNKAIEYF